MIHELKHGGGKLDLFTREEFRSELRSWGQELLRGARFRRRAMAGAVSGSGALTIRDPGPAEGFVWAVTRISLTMTATTAGMSLFTNGTDPSAVLWRGLGATGTPMNVVPGQHGLIVMPGDELILSGSGLTNNELITAVLQIKEVPEQMAWAL